MELIASKDFCKICFFTELDSEYIDFAYSRHDNNNDRAVDCILNACLNFELTNLLLLIIIIEIVFISCVYPIQHHRI